MWATWTFKRLACPNTTLEATLRHIKMKERSTSLMQSNVRITACKEPTRRTAYAKRDATAYITPHLTPLWNVSGQGAQTLLGCCLWSLRVTRRYIVNSFKLCEVKSTRAHHQTSAFMSLVQYGRHQHVSKRLTMMMMIIIWWNTTLKLPSSSVWTFNKPISYTSTNTHLPVLCLNKDEWNLHSPQHRWRVHPNVT